jgi:MFS-type transporter involved in bile tolerance (Atg22 family)
MRASVQNYQLKGVLATGIFLLLAIPPCAVARQLSHGVRTLIKASWKRQI